MTKVVLDKETIESRLSVVPYITLATKLRQLVAGGSIEEQKIYHPDRPGFPAGTAYTYEGRRIKFVMNFVGIPKWNHNFDPALSFFEPHDLALDAKTNTLLVFAKS